MPELRPAFNPLNKKKACISRLFFGSSRSPGNAPLHIHASYLPIGVFISLELKLKPIRNMAWANVLLLCKPFNRLALVVSSLGRPGQSKLQTINILCHDRQVFYMTCEGVCLILQHHKGPLSVNRPEPCY